MIKIIVCVKQVPDPTVVKFNIETGKLDNVNYLIDPVDEVAVSEAIRVRDRDGGKVTVISLGPPHAEEALRTALKMGANEAIHLFDEAFDNLDSYSTSVIIAKQITKLEYDIVLCGRESADENNGFLGAAIAEWLGLPLVTAVTRLDVFSDTKTARVHRRLRGGDREILECSLPAVFTVETVLRKPVYAPLKTILAGLKKEVKKVDAKSLGVDARSIEPAVAMLSISQPKPRLKKTATIDSKLSAHERMKLLMSGGILQKGSKTIEKPPADAAKEIIQFLINNGIITK